MKYSAILFILIMFFTGCSTPPDPIKMVDLNTFESFEFQVTVKPENWPLTSDITTINKTDAHDTKNYMLLKTMIYDLEKNTFEIAKSKQAFSTFTVTDDYDLQLQIQSLHKYSIFINTVINEGYILNEKHSIKLSTEHINMIYNSELLPINNNDYLIPFSLLYFEKELLETSGNNNYTHSLYKDRVYEQALNYTSNSQTLTITKPKDGFTLELQSTSSLLTTEIAYKISDIDTKEIISSKAITSKDEVLNILLPSSNGNFIIDLIITRNNEKLGFGTENLQLAFTIESDEIYTLNQETYEPGDLIIIKGDYIDSDLNYTINTDIYNKGLKFLPDADSHYMFIPLMSKTEPGTYSVTINDSDYQELVTNLEIIIKYKQFEEQYLETSSETASLRNDEAYEQLNEAFSRGRKNLSLSKYWDGPFLSPVTGRVSTEYGEIRYTNGSVVSSRHSGIDFAVPKGTVVNATQNGYVTLSESLTITGNTLFIDHGFGIVSQHYHLDKIYVIEGDYVKTGDPVAEVGNTGFSTGAHLHFTIYHNGIYINPWKLFEKAPF